MRYLIKFSKESEIKFISHLDLMSTLQRIIRRANLPVEYSQGFNPHMSLSIAQPLSVGIYSKGEYMDLVLKDDLDENKIKNDLMKCCPLGIKIFSVKKVPHEANTPKIPPTMAFVEAASYEINIKYMESSCLNYEMDSLLLKEEWITPKKSKSGEKIVNIKPMLKEFEYEVMDNILILKTIISCGSRENLSPELLSSFIKRNTTAAEENTFVDINRLELLTYQNEKFIPIMDIDF